AFDSFCRRAEAGSFPRLADRDSLWRLLVTITARQAGQLLRGEGRQKRGGRAAAPGGAGGGGGSRQGLRRGTRPEFAGQSGEGDRRLLRVLGDPELEAVALWRMEGYSVEEIAGRLGFAPRSVKRKLQLIRGLWEEETSGE